MTKVKVSKQTKQNILKEIKSYIDLLDKQGLPVSNHDSNVINNRLASHIMNEISVLDALRNDNLYDLEVNLSDYWWRLEHRHHYYQVTEIGNHIIDCLVHPKIGKYHWDYCSMPTINFRDLVALKSYKDDDFLEMEKTKRNKFNYDQFQVYFVNLDDLMSMLKQFYRHVQRMSLPKMSVAR